ncbi:MAG: hypothetical protein ABUK01_03495 [Leptospirales bacterium]
MELTDNTDLVLRQSYRACAKNRDFWNDVYYAISSTTPEAISMFSQEPEPQIKGKILEAADTLLWYSLDCSSTGAIWGRYGKYVRKLPVMTCLDELPPYTMWEWRDILISKLTAYEPQMNEQIKQRWSDILKTGVDLIIASTLNRQIKKVI